MGSVQQTRARTAAVLLVLSLGVVGCEGCEGGRAHRALNRFRYRNNPKCVFEEDCADVLKCPPWLTPGCLPSGMVGVDDDARPCICTPFRHVPTPDGGLILEACVRNPDGGTPICGPWDGHRLAILGEDGGVIVDKDGGVL